MRDNKLGFFLEKVSQGVLLSLCILAVLFAINKDAVLGQLCLYEIMPLFEINSNMKTLFKFSPKPAPETADAFVYGEEAIISVNNIAMANEPETLIGLNDVLFQPETDYNDNFHGMDFVVDDLAALHDMDYLKKSFYTVDKRTDVTADLFDVDNFLASDLSIDNAVDGPKVLVFHTHSTERYSDSGSGEGVLSVGSLLCETLENKYGIQSLHNTQSFDVLDGKSHVLGAYERMEPVISGILKDNPSIQCVIDIHRDGVRDDVRLVHNVNGKPTAQIMFFNGLSRLYDDGNLVDIAGLANPNLKQNLAFSFNMQLASNTLYPGLARKVYLNAYRYSLHMLPKSLLVEVGAQTNTQQEALNAVEPLAEILANVILK